MSKEVDFEVDDKFVVVIDDIDLEGDRNRTDASPLACRLCQCLYNPELCRKAFSCRSTIFLLVPYAYRPAPVALGYRYFSYRCTAMKFNVRPYLRSPLSVSLEEKLSQASLAGYV